MNEFHKDKLKVKIYDTRAELGKFAALDVKNKILDLVRYKQEIRMIFAAAPSQNELLQNLISFDDIPWNKITAFHMDEYIGLNPSAEQLFGNFLEEKIFGKVNFKKVNYLNSNPENLETECARYTELLNEAPIDIVCLGIGENGHIAFNDPPVADFNDPKLVKVVELDNVSRRQQVNDGCFNSFDDVPAKAISLTIPALLSASFLFTVVPGKTKAKAVKEVLTHNIESKYPASVLRTHDNAVLYLDSDSASTYIIQTQN